MPTEVNFATVFDDLQSKPTYVSEVALSAPRAKRRDSDAGFDRLRVPWPKLKNTLHIPSDSRAVHFSTLFLCTIIYACR